MNSIKSTKTNRYRSTSSGKPNYAGSAVLDAPQSSNASGDAALLQLSEKTAKKLAMEEGLIPLAEAMRANLIRNVRETAKRSKDDPGDWEM